MATSKPRITVTLDPHRHELLRRLAGHQGTSMSAIVSELVDAVAPVLERVCVAIESAKNAQDSVKANLLRVAEESESAILPMLDAAISQLDIFVNACNEAGSATPQEGSEGTPPRGEGPRPTEAENPRPVITGVRSTQKEKKGKPTRRGSHAV